jgi:Tfp pilus assembly protein PilF
VVQLARGKQEAAEAAFKKAIEVGPKSVAGYLALANYYWAADRLTDAEATLKRALTLDPLNSNVNRGLALSAIMNGKVLEAEPYIERMAAVSKDGKGRLVLADYYIAA